MPDVTLFGFPRSVYVQMAGIVLTHKEVPYAFHDLETEMNTPSHLALHPFERVPILRHGDFTVYETAAIVGYVDDAFDGPKLTPNDPQSRGRMNQWISAVNGYYYPYLIYHVSHERNVFPQLGIPSDETVVAHAVPMVETCLEVLDRDLSGGEFLVGSQLKARHARSSSSGRSRFGPDTRSLMNRSASPFLERAPSPAWTDSGMA